MQYVKLTGHHYPGPINGNLLGHWESKPTTNCFQDLKIRAYWKYTGISELVGHFPGAIDEVRIAVY
ncbi:MAG: hypothetical protein ACETWQ_06580 [Phycisphaerae bacterium]